MSHIKLIFMSFMVFVSAAILTSKPVIAFEVKRPKLVLVLVYDQLRSDYLTRFRDQFLPTRQKNGKVGGFRYLMETGAYFPVAEYEVMQSMTCPGHAMILTGSYPYENGISLNEWFDGDANRITYCVEDKDFGMSPRRLKGSTVGDELKMNSPESKVVSVAIKDRAAIMLGGHAADLALWLDIDKIEWESSAYYSGRSDLKWLQTFKETTRSFKDHDVQWDASLIKDKFSYHAKAASGEAMGFPFGVELTNKAAIKLLDTYKLGQGSVTDILAVSFSSHDISGHRFGPNSPEMLELTLREDRLLADFLNAVRAKVPGGLKDVVIVLTADHGVAPLPSVAKKFGIDAGTIDQKDILGKLNEALIQKFGKAEGGRWLSAYQYFNFYFNPANAKTLKPVHHDVLQFSQKWMANQPGVAFAFTADDYANKNLPSGLMNQQIMKSYIPGINGDIMIIPQPFWYEASSKNAATHMTGYAYDRSVPLIMVGAGIRAGIYPQFVHVVDLAPTLSFMLGQVAPALNEGRVLDEIFTRR